MTLPNETTIEKLIADVAILGGAIVCTAEIHQVAVADARADGRYAVTDDGIGYVRLEKEWLRSTMEKSSKLKDALAKIEKIARDATIPF